MVKVNINYIPQFFITLLIFSSSYPTHAVSLERLFKKVNPAVVLINTEKIASTNNGKTNSVNSSGLGSGVLISEDGKVLTAAHVIQASDFINVQFLDGSIISAEVVTSFVAADIALLKLSQIPKNIKPAKLGDSNKVSEGAQVFVIGAPYGLSHSLTVGHISARHAPNTTVSELEMGEFLQTDAAINKGNSGGPMFNMDGEVIGIVSHILSQSGGSEGLGFALTSNTAKKLVLEKPSFWSGLKGYRLPVELARILNVPQTTALLVQKICCLFSCIKIRLTKWSI